MANLHTFDDWNDKKKALHAADHTVLFKEGQIWWCSLGVNVGEEVLGKGPMYSRPVIILRKFTSNTCVVLPTTTKNKNGSWYFRFEINGITRSVMMHQIRFISIRRLHSQESTLPEPELTALKKAVAILYGL